ncbi:unnamed protein product [Rotaria sp. Silwood2]|nr:unnamed protein product [Rotaria sp. Silwood2]CAF4310323.1 unnamed protein product [Rotaria sp. Silwood2]
MKNQDQEAIKTKSISTFNNLSSELILNIFEYLSVADRYKSFFDYDIRLRQLVKRWTSYSRKELDIDIVRFSTLHSWYKISLENGGRQCFIYPRRGQQSQCNDLDDKSDTTNLHWWIIYYGDEPMIADERVRAIIARHSFRLSPFFYHDKIGALPRSSIDGKQPLHTFYGGHIIVDRNDTRYVEPWLKSNYPDHADRILNRSSRSRLNIDEICAPIFEAEWLKTTQIIRQAAYQVWEELKNLEDINPLEIRALR